MHSGFSFDKLKNKVAHHRHSLDHTGDELSLTKSNRSHSLDHTHDQFRFQKSLTPPAQEPSRLRSSSFSLVNGISASNQASAANAATNSTSTAARRESTSSSLHGLHLPRSRSRSRSHSVVHSKTLSPSNIFRSKTKELIKHETAQVISKKLLHELTDLGLQNPIPLKTSIQGSVAKSVKVYVSNTNDCIYLPPASSTSFTYEDVENGGMAQQDEESDVDASPLTPESADFNPRTTPRTSFSTDSSEHHPSASLHQQMKAFRAPNYLCTKIDSEYPIPHTFAVIVELIKDQTTIKDLTIRFQSLTQILWPTLDPYNRSHSKEKFKIGNMEWTPSLNDADYYISTSNSNDVKSKNLAPEELAKRTREYKLVNIKDWQESARGNVSEEQLGEELSTSNSSSHSSHITHSNLNSNSNSNSNLETTHKAGLYVFLLPILLPEHIPASIVSINGSLIHTLSINFNKISDKLSRKLKVDASYNLPMVRTPPNFANSIADKPIYVNRVWNDSVHYMITFPRKYVSLGSEHVINVKLVPLVKDVIVKRVKFNVLERITYVSKSLSKEYDYDSEDPYCLHPSKEGKVRERVVSICELKTKSKQSTSSFGDSYKEEVVKCPENNLLFSCYEPESEVERPKTARKKQSQSKPAAERMIASPLDINIALPFLTTKNDKVSASSNPDEEEQLLIQQQQQLAAQSTPRKASLVNETGPSGKPMTPYSPVIGALETNLANVDELGPHELAKPNSSNFLSDDLSLKHTPPENIKNGYTLIARGLYPDSNYRHIQINHRLQVCFRISKPDPKDHYKMHHYEVVVDTPLILLSSKCNEGSIQLPKYDELEGFAGGDGVVFNTPNYNHNGVTIREWNQGANNDDPLPTFEEATSPVATPLTRTFSIPEDPLSRVPSIPMVMPGEPAPAYEQHDTTHLDEASMRHHSSTIDEVINVKGSTPASRRRQSSIRESLSHSLLPNKEFKPRPMSNHSSSSDDRSLESGSSNSAPDVNGTPATSSLPDSTSISSASFAIESVLNEATGGAGEELDCQEPIGPLREVDECAVIDDDDDDDDDDGDDDDNDDTNLNDNNEEHEHEDDQVEDTETSLLDNESNVDADTEDGDDAEEVGSLLTQEANFVQRLPLLKQMSTDTIRTQATTMMHHSNAAAHHHSPRTNNGSSDNVSIFPTSSNISTFYNPQDIQKLNF
ncbi:uncharacterized protein LODBEIA_P07210 [Lodderomyces beijingensis]|uniref:Arrestin C-terminal-like domain-containing protein n=1 Tax=Lodderomyces beijingensis TaxID=1775926 RepID=A0ABP0ZK18_9ASCO